MNFHASIINIRTFFIVLLMLFSFTASARDLPDFTELAKENSPAVVNIATSQKITKQQQQLQIPDLPEDSPLNDFFRHFFGDGMGPGSQQPASSLGSGFIISKDGYVITNNHVIDNAEEIIVRLNDRREFTAELIGTDASTDLAVLKIDATNLPTIKIGSSKELEVGEWVLAIGSPFGFDYSVTAGIVSAKGRSLPNESYTPFIQTDVAINPGNSGGPLFNLDGEAVGVNSQIYSRTGGFMGLSFAIPMDIVMNIYTQLKDKGVVSRGWLGVMIQDVTRELAESFNMKKPGGALVAKVLDESPAANAGLRSGDIILNFNGQEIHTSSELPPIVGATKVGKKTPVIILREGKRKTISITIRELPGNEQLASSSTLNNETDVNASRLKIIAKDLDDDIREQLGLEDHGVLVEKVEEGPAQKAGIKPGDVLLRLNNEIVRDIKSLKKIAKALPAGRAFPVLIQRENGPMYVAIEFP